MKRPSNCPIHQKRYITRLVHSISQDHLVSAQCGCPFCFPAVFCPGSSQVQDLENELGERVCGFLPQKSTPPACPRAMSAFPLCDTHAHKREDADGVRCWITLQWALLGQCTCPAGAFGQSNELVPLIAAPRRGEEALSLGVSRYQRERSSDSVHRDRRLQGDARWRLARVAVP